MMTSTEFDRPTLADGAQPINRLLERLSPVDWAALLPQMEWLKLVAGESLHRAGDLVRNMIFPATAVVSLLSSLRDGSGVEVAMVGREGVVGACALAGDGQALTSASVLSAGFAWRVSAPWLVQQARLRPALHQALLGYQHAVMRQMCQAAACYRHHRLDGQLCRWLLAHRQRLQGDEIVATQEGIARLLGVRREGVTAAAMNLQEMGLIRYGRGRITLLNIAGLAELACECHGHHVPHDAAEMAAT